LSDYPCDLGPRTPPTPHVLQTRPRNPNLHPNPKQTQGRTTKQIITPPGRTRNQKIHRSERSEAELPDVGRGTVRHMPTPRRQMSLAGPATPNPPLCGPLDHDQELRSGYRARSGAHRRWRRWLRRAGDKWDRARIVVL